MGAAFLRRESKRLNLLTNAGLPTGTEAHTIVQDKVMCKDTTKHTGIAPNTKEEERKEKVCAQARRGNRKPDSRIPVSTVL